MTDHLEPYRRMVRSMRFFPPLPLEQPSLNSIVDGVAPEPASSSNPQTVRSEEAEPPVPRPPIDLSEHIATLVREAVSKKSVLPTSYAIPENIGDRISRMTTKKVIPVIAAPKFPQYDDIPSTEAKHVESLPVEQDKQAEDPISATVVAEPEVVEETATAEVPTNVTEPEPEETAQKEVVATVVAEPVEEATDEEISAEVVATTSEEETAEVDTPTAVVEESTPEVETSDRTPESTAATEEVSADTEESPSFGEQVAAVVETVATTLKDLVTGDKQTDKAEVSAPAAKETTVVERVATTLKDLVTDDKADETEVSAPAAKETTFPSQVDGVSCPQCNSDNLRKNGHRRGNQRYVCKDCGKNFMVPETTLAEAKSSARSQTQTQATKTKKPQPSADSIPEPKGKDLQRRGKLKKKAKGFGSK
ncbi:MAG: hypothetical protein KME06_16350 [Kastovskya adunca ATA6-11-RM4]|nr:hypothetical protein [Kastovskya adunca ATA6-11-RM4]